MTSTDLFWREQDTTPDAIEALNLLRPKLCVPMHYDTLDKIRQNPHAFAKSAAAAGHQVRVMGAGETIEI